MRFSLSLKQIRDCKRKFEVKKKIKAKLLSGSSKIQSMVDVVGLDQNQAQHMLRMSCSNFYLDSGRLQDKMQDQSAPEDASPYSCQPQLPLKPSITTQQIRNSIKRGNSKRNKLAQQTSTTPIHSMTSLSLIMIPKQKTATHIAVEHESNQYRSNSTTAKANSLQQQRLNHQPSPTSQVVVVGRAGLRQQRPEQKEQPQPQ